MSESKEHFYRDFSKFDEMSTEELNEILRQDSQLPDGEDSDTDAILYIMGVIAKRNQELPSSDFGDVNHAWSSFNKNYRFASSEGCSLFDFDDFIISLNAHYIAFNIVSSPSRKICSLVCHDIVHCPIVFILLRINGVLFIQ